MAEAAEQPRSHTDEDRWPAGERAATLIRLAAHARGGGEEHIGRVLIEEAQGAVQAVRSRAGLPRRHTLSYDLALRMSGTGQEAPAARHFADALTAYASCGQNDMALNSFDPD